LKDGFLLVVFAEQWFAGGWAKVSLPVLAAGQCSVQRPHSTQE
jgi:hypothetical protein